MLIVLFDTYLTLRSNERLGLNQDHSNSKYSTLTYFPMSLAHKYPNGHTTSNPRQFDVDITSIHQIPNFDKFPIIFVNFFKVISMAKKCTLFPCTFFDVISMVGKSTLFPRTLSNIISMAKKSTLFHVFFPR